MHSKALRLSLCSIAAIFMACLCMRAQSSAGLYNSPRGFGVSVQTAKGLDRFNTISMYADIYGMPTGRQETPGIHLNYSSNHILLTRSASDYDISIYAGPGASMGWLHDCEYLPKSKEHLLNNPGLMTAISGTAGLRSVFAGNIILDLSFACEVGLHIRNDEVLTQKDLTLYLNGLLNSWMPQLLILWKF